MKYKMTPEFREDYAALPEAIKAKVKRAFELFQQDPRHPSLHTKKIRGTEGIFEGRIDRQYRFTFHYEGDAVFFRKVGPHHIIDEEASRG